MSRPNIYLDGIKTQYRAEPNSFPLIILTGSPEEKEELRKLSTMMTGVKLQKIVALALGKIPKGKRAAFLRGAITQAVINANLLEEGTYKWSPDYDSVLQPLN
jgi:hypothetical protein